MLATPASSRTRSIARRLGFAVVALACWAAAGAPSAGAVVARPADSFVESVGVNVHLGYSDTAYNQFSSVRKALDELGVRYVRDGVGLNRTTVYSRFRTLAADGIRTDMIVGEPMERWGVGSLDQQLDMINRELGSAVVSLEGPNEYDIQGDPNWVANLRDYQRRLWEGAHARPSLASLPILGPSFASGDGPAEAGNLSAWTDEGNIHPYPGGEQPDRNSHLEGELALAAKSTGSEPVEATETGYHNAVNDIDNGHRPTSERAAGIYMPRLFLDYFRRGIKRTYAYELLDLSNDATRSDAGHNFGLLRNDFSEKPAFTATKRLIGLLEDPGASFAPGSLTYSLQGAPSSARQLLLQKRDGSFYLVLWNQVNAWDTDRLVDLDPADPQATLQLGQPIARAEVFRPNDSAAPLSTVSSPSSVSLALSEKVTIVHLVPAVGGQQPAPEPTPAPVSAPEPAPAPAPEPQPAPAPAPSPSVASDTPSAPSGTKRSQRKQRRTDNRRSSSRRRLSGRAARVSSARARPALATG